MNNIIIIFEKQFSKILSKHKTKKYLLNTNLRRVDFYKVYDILPQNIINKYDKLFYKYNTLNSWNSFTLLLALYSNVKKIINNDELDMVIYRLNRYMFNKDGYYSNHNEFISNLGIYDEIERCNWLLLLAILKQAMSEGDVEFVNSYLEGYRNKDKLMEFLNNE
jgi:hypothetical protein